MRHPTAFPSSLSSERESSGALMTTMGGAAAAVLGSDGRGYELARRLEGNGAWRAWMGDAYAAFAPALASPAAWDAFLSPSASSTPQHLRLQLRARALLFDKASAALFLRPTTTSSASLSSLNPSYLQLHGDDIYFSLEDEQQDGAHQQAQSKAAFSPCKGNEHSYERASSVGSRYSESESENTSHRHRHDELPDTWYDTWYSLRAYKMRTHQKLLYCDKELHKRTSEGMCAYLRLREIHKRRRQAFRGDPHTCTGDPKWENGSYVHPGTASETNISAEEENFFFPEIMFPSNCVPDTALPLASGLEENRKVEICGALDNLPGVTSPSPAMMERFGLRPEYIRMGSKYRGKDGSGENRNPLSEEQASQMTHKMVARLLAGVGFEGGTEVSVEVFSDYIRNHVCKLGRILKVLTDSYRKQFSSIELLKMFLQTAGYSNLGILADMTKDGNKGMTHQTQQHLRTLQSQHQSSLLQAQQFQRQMHPQMNMLHPQNLAFQQQQQQQWNKLQRRQPTTPRSSATLMDKDQAMVDVKMENIMESTMDSTFGSLNKHQMQMRHQHQQMVMANQNAQAGQQFKQLPSVQISQLQPQNAYNNMRTQPVKVEAFHELVGGDSALKHESDLNKLTSPQK